MVFCHTLQLTKLLDGWQERFWERPPSPVLIGLVLVSLAVISPLSDLPRLPCSLVYPAGPHSNFSWSSTNSECAQFESKGLEQKYSVFFKKNLFIS